MRLRQATAIVAAGLCLIGAPSLDAQESRWARQVSARLAQTAAALGVRTYRLDGGALNTAESASFSVVLPQGVAAVLTGVCDDDCDQLDLSVSANGYETAAARGGGNAPIVRVRPRETVTYRVTVYMAGCRVNPCWYGVGVFLAR